MKDKFLVSTKEILKKCDIIFIGCPHDEYKGIKFNKKIKVIDCWGSVVQ